MQLLNLLAQIVFETYLIDYRDYSRYCSNHRVINLDEEILLLQIEGSFLFNDYIPFSEKTF